jgi:flagellar hook-associated protein 3 FlgL
MLIKPSIISAYARTSETMATASLRTSTGKRINSASDDPTGFNKLAVTKASLSTTGVNISSLEAGIGRTDARDQTLSSVQDAVDRFRELTTMAASGLNKLSDILPEMKSIAASVQSLGNTKDARGFMFAGTANTTPFTLDATGAVQYSGSGVSQQFTVEGITMSGSIDGSPLMDVFSAMGNVVNQMTAGTPPTTAQLDAVGLASETVLSLRTAGAAEAAGATRVVTALTARSDRESAEADSIEAADPTQELLNYTEGQKLQEAILKIMGTELNKRRLMDRARLTDPNN